MSKKYTVSYIAVSIILILISYTFNYKEYKTEVYSRVNEIFCQEAPYWFDSIIYIRKYPYSGRYNTLMFPRKTDATIIYEYPSYSNNIDTIIIPKKYINNNYKDYFKFSVARRQTACLLCYKVEMPLFDSLFMNSMQLAGIQADVATELHIKNLHDIFSTSDTMIADAPVRDIFKSDTLNTFEYTSDTVSVGICGHGYMFSRANVSDSYIYDGMQWMSVRQIILLILLIIVYAVLYLGCFIRNKMQGMIIIGNTCVDLKNNVLYTWNGLQKPFTGNRILLLNMFIDSPDGYRLYKEYICRMVWNRDTKSAQALYNILISDVRALFEEDDSLELKTIHNTGIEIVVNGGSLKRFRRLHFMLMLLKKILLRPTI